MEYIHEQRGKFSPEHQMRIVKLYEAVRDKRNARKGMGSKKDMTSFERYVEVNIASFVCIIFVDPHISCVHTEDKLYIQVPVFLSGVPLGVRVVWMVVERAVRTVLELENRSMILFLETNIAPGGSAHATNAFILCTFIIVHCAIC